MSRKWPRYHRWKWFYFFWVPLLTQNRVTIVIFQNSVNFTKMHSSSSMLYTPHTLSKLLSIIEHKMTSISSMESILIFLSSIIDRKSRDSLHFSKKCKFYTNAYQLNHAIYPSYPSETTINNWAENDLDIIGGNDFNFFEFHYWHKIAWQSSFFKIV